MHRRSSGVDAAQSPDHVLHYFGFEVASHQKAYVVPLLMVMLDI